MQLPLLLSQPLPNAHHAGIVQVDSVSNLITIGLPVILTTLVIVHNSRGLKIQGTVQILCIT